MVNTAQQLKWGFSRELFGSLYKFRIWFLFLCLSDFKHGTPCFKHAFACRKILLNE